MVFLRLTVKISPREQRQSASSSLFRSFLPDRKDDSDKNGNGGANGKPTSFLLVLEHPEEVTLGGLAGMIQNKWKKLRPDAEPLEIKKLVDDAHDSEDLDADMTVADVFVDNGKARADGLDQRGTVRVIQKPAPYAPTRFSSVVQDWDAAAQHYERMKQEDANNKPKVPKFETIEEENTPVSSRFSHDVYDSNGSRRQSDVPVRSVERDQPALSPPRWGRRAPELAAPSREPERDEEVEATPQKRRMESKELGESPTPIRQLAPETFPDPFTRPGSPDVGNRRQRSGSRSQPVHQIETKFPVGQQEPASDPVHESPQHDVDMTDVEPEPEPQRETQRTASPAVVIDNPALRSVIEKKARAAATRKRKNSGDELPPQKEPRLELTGSPSATRSKSKEPTTNEEHVETPETSSPVRRREKAPSFSGPQRRPSLSDHSAKPGLGLGITKSPPRKRSISHTDERLSGRDPMSTTPLLPSGVARRLSFGQHTDGTPSKVQSPGLEHVKRSAMRKDSPLERNQERRSVSFAEEADIVTTPAAPAPRSTPRSIPRSSSKADAKADKRTPRSTPPSSQTIVYPPNVDPERLQQIIDEAEKKAKQKAEGDKAIRAPEYESKIKAAEKSGNHELVRLLRDVFFAWKEMDEMERSSQRNNKRRLTRLRLKFKDKEQLLLEKEKAMALSEEEKRGPKAVSANRPSSRDPAKSRSAAKSNGIPQSSLASNDVDLPTVMKTRSTDIKRASDVPEQTSTVAKRQIVKADIPPDDISESDDDENEPDNKSATSEDGTDSSASAESAVISEEIPPAAKDDQHPEKEAEEADEDEDDGPAMAKAEMLERVRSPARSRSGSVPAGTGSPSKSPGHITDKKASDANERESSVSESSSESEPQPQSEPEDESDEDFIPPGRTSAPPPSTAPAALNGTDVLFNGPALRSSARSSFGSFTSSQPGSAGKRSRTGLKDILAEQKSLQAERAKTLTQRALSNQNHRPARKNIFSPSGSSESESESDSGDDTDTSDDDRGDILPTGSATKTR